MGKTRQKESADAFKEYATPLPTTYFQKSHSGTPLWWMSKELHDLENLSGHRDCSGTLLVDGALWWTTVRTNTPDHLDGNSDVHNTVCSFCRLVPFPVLCFGCQRQTKDKHNTPSHLPGWNSERRKGFRLPPCASFVH